MQVHQKKPEKQTEKKVLAAQGAAGFHKLGYMAGPLFFYLCGTAVTEGILSILFVLFVVLSGTEAAKTGLVPFLAQNAYWLLAAGSGILLPAFFLRRYHADWQRRVTGDPPRFQERESGVDKCGPIRLFLDIPQKGLLFLTALLAAIGLTAGVNLLSSMGLPVLEGVAEENAAMQSTNAWVVFLVTVGIVPFFEELVFRGLCYRRIRDYFGFGTAALVSAAAFGMLHGNLGQALFAFGMGLFLAWVYERSNMLAAAVLCHAAANAVNFVLLAIEAGWVSLGKIFTAAENAGALSAQPAPVAGNSGGAALLLFLTAGGCFVFLIRRLSERLPREVYRLYTGKQA